MRKQIFFITVLLFSCTILYAQDPVIIDPDSTHQIIRGFGGNYIRPWRPEMTDSEIETAFGTDDGQLGFSILRIMIQPDIDDWIMNVSVAKKAYDMGVTIIASPWNPPEYMLDPDASNNKLSYDWYYDYAYHLEDFNYFMERNDVPIYAISIQNEPDYGEWTRWTANEILTFMKENASEITTRIMAPESFQFRRAYSDPILNDEEACENLDILAGHIYGGGLYPYPLAVSKGKEVWMTEYYTDSQHSANLWPMALDVGTNMHKVMNAGMNTYVWWYIVRYYGPISDGTMDSGEKGDVTKRGYIMSQYSRFIRPGFYRIECTDEPQNNVFVTSYKNSSASKIIIVAVNTSSQTKNQSFSVQNGVMDYFTPYVTSETKNCLRENDSSVSSGSFSFTLDAQSVTTFVSSDNTAVENKSSSLPGSFELLQNYPNPFNPSTRINFKIPEKSHVSIKIYNALGEEIQELAGRDYTAGSHSIILDASHLANGIYFYKIKAGNFKETRKMSLIK